MADKNKETDNIDILAMSSLLAASCRLRALIKAQEKTSFSGLAVTLLVPVKLVTLIDLSTLHRNALITHT